MVSALHLFVTKVLIKGCEHAELNIKSLCLTKVYKRLQKYEQVLVEHSWVAFWTATRDPIDADQKSKPDNPP